ncbi:UNVERIFIED_CONTAM: hypothetical protein Slati_1465100 [Sesamum latifolium]|uniref:RNase H type-1 domain-containing protein n=1 Tax=Sesamum latifolium TaxID=2727402 RepID=A0AAW2X8H5_9LAMI
MTGMVQEEVSEKKPWLLHVDGSSTMQGSGAGVVLTSPQGDDVEFAIKFEFKASNNEAEYEALVLGMRMAQDIGAPHLLAYSDSQLIVKQVNAEYEAKEESMVKYLQQIEELKTSSKASNYNKFLGREYQGRFSIQTSQRLRGLQNTAYHHATSTPTTNPTGYPAHFLNNNDWRTPIVRWISESHLPEDRWETTKIKARAIRFLIQGGMLYKKSFTHHLLICLAQEEGLHVLKEIHDGCCGSHIGTWALANKALRAGYFWPTMKQDARYLANGQVEVTNRILVQGYQEKTGQSRRHWVEELTSVLWSYRTTPRGFTGESPFTLVYGTEAVIPAELGMPSRRVLHFAEEHNSQLLKERLDLVDELRETAFIRIQRYKGAMINAHNKRVKARYFQVGDLVLRRVDTLKPVGKLDPKWEGPYKITKIIGNGAYELEDAEGRILSRPGTYTT